MDNGSRIRDSIDIMWQELLKPEWCPHLDSWFCTRFSCHGCSPSFNSSFIVSRWRWAIEWGRGDYILSPMCTVVLFNAVIVTRWTHDSMTWELVWMILVTDPLCVLDQPTCHVPVLHPSPIIPATVAFFSKK
jgi:hypothetical protein